MSNPASSVVSEKDRVSGSVGSNETTNLSNRSGSTKTLSSSKESDSTHLGAIRFGMVRIGERRLRSFSFVNPGPMELKVVELSLFPQRTAVGASADCAHFSILRAPTLPHSMRPHETCKCVVSFHPSAETSPTAILAIVPAGNHPRQHVELSGCGITTSPVPRSTLPSIAGDSTSSHFPSKLSPSGKPASSAHQGSPCTPAPNGPCADSLPVLTPMRTQKQQQVVTTPVSGAPAPPYPVQYPVEHSEPPAEGSPEEVAWLRRRVRRLEQAFGSYAKEIARHNTEVAKVFAALSQGGEIKSEERTPGKISMADIAEFERCDEWEAFAAQESEGETGQKQDWPGFSPAKFVNVNEIDVTGEMQGKEQQAAFRTPLAERRKNVCTPGTDPLSGIQKHKMMTPTPATPMMDELPMDALDEVGVGGNADTGFTPPPSAMKFCPPPVTPSMHSMQSLESAACM